MSTSPTAIMMATPALISPADHAALFPKRGVKPDMRLRLLDGILKCWVPNCGGPMGYGNESGGRAYGCKHTSHDSKYSGLISLNAASLDRLAIEAIQQVLPANSVAAGIAAELERELKDRETLAELEIAQIASAHLMARRNYDEALSRALSFDASTQDDMQSHLDAFKKEKLRLAGLEAELRAQVVQDRAKLTALSSDARVFFDALEKLKSKLPFRPETEAELRIYETCRAMLETIELQLSGENTHNVMVTVRLSAGSATTPGITKQVIFKDRVVMARCTNLMMRKSERLAKLSAAGGKLTDEEYNSLPDGLMRFYEEERYRHVLDAFARESEDINFRGIMRLEGHRKGTEHIVQYLLVGGRRELLQQHLKKTRGSDYRLASISRQAKFSELGYLAHAKHPVVLLEIARPGGPERLTDAQWYAIAGEVKALKIQSRWGDDHPRDALDRYFALLRSDLPFSHVEGIHCKDKPWGSLVPKFQMGKHPTKLRKVLDILLRMEGWQLPKKYSLPVVSSRFCKADKYDEALIEDIAGTIEKIAPSCVIVPEIERYSCNDLVINLTEESILFPDGTRWHTGVREKRFFQTLMLEGIKRSDYRQYTRHLKLLPGFVDRLADRLADFSEELAGAVYFDKDAETYRIDLPVTRLS